MNEQKDKTLPLLRRCFFAEGNSMTDKTKNALHLAWQCAII